MNMVKPLQSVTETGFCQSGRALAWGCLVCGLFVTSHPLLAQSVMLLADSSGDLSEASLGLGIDTADFSKLASESRSSSLTVRPTATLPGRMRPAADSESGAEASGIEDAAVGLPGMSTPGVTSPVLRGFDPSLARPRIRTAPAVPLPFPVNSRGGVVPATEAVRAIPRPMVGPAVGVRPRPLTFPGSNAPRR
jgi:hypothetical protein